MVWKEFVRIGVLRGLFVGALVSWFWMCPSCLVLLLQQTTGIVRRSLQGPLPAFGIWLGLLLLGTCGSRLRSPALNRQTHHHTAATAGYLLGFRSSHTMDESTPWDVEEVITERKHNHKQARIVNARVEQFSLE